MKIQIMGAGALGSLVGAILHLSGFDVLFVARGRQLEALESGLKVSGLMEATMKVNVSSRPEDAEITFVTVKAYDTERAAEMLSEVNPGIVCSLQNGVGNEEILQKYCEKVLGGVTSYAANLADFGHVIYAGEGFTYVGELDGRLSEDALKVAEILKKAGMNCEAVDNIRFRIWAKAVVNAAINPVTAICGVRNGRIVENEYLWKVSRAVAEEGGEVMKRMGYEFDAVGEVRRVAEMTASNRSSMLQDFERRRKTEIEFINGAIVRKGKELGVHCPVNETLLNIVRGIESEFSP
ncbi:ketopantoate reductase family protein [Archaeoglobus neptunius]|uniref:ketopantoate reductase family protein n=1 Tax=Archaeoglobus neptunius TaxID=2798580 RepID=UPI001E572EA3|nr:ketopantoate reductase family protein [Archaeoglobus neptunius]